MKTTIITCDVCKKVLDNEYIKIGGEMGQEFAFKNKLPAIGSESIKRNIIRSRDIHFCSKEHFIKYFFSL